MTLKALLRVRLLGIKASLTGANRSNKKRSRASIIGFSVLMLYSFGYFVFMMYMIFSQLAEPFAMLGYGAVYFAMAAIMSFCLMFIGSVFTSKAQLYEAKDNDLLLSMPIKPGEVLLSRMLTLLLIDLGLGLVVSGPAIFAWAQVVGFDLAWFIPCLIVLIVLLPLFTLLVAALFGWLLHLVSARVRNQSLLTVGLSLAFLAVYFVAISRMNIWLTEIVKDPSPLVGALSGFAPPIWIGRACAEGNLPALGGLVLGTAALALLGWILLSRGFLHAATDNRGAAKIKYVEKRVNAVSPDRALLRRELKHLGSSPAYIMNCALGAIMAPVAAVFLIVKRDSFLPLLAMPGLGEYLPLMMLLGLCFLSAMCTLTGPSISIEGKSMWLLKSLPVTPRQALSAKLRMHLLVGLPPMLLCSVIFIVLLRPEPLTAVCCFLLPAACMLFVGLFGLFENLRHPNFDWVNETQAVKTGMSMFAVIFGTMALVMLPIPVVLIWGDRIPVSLLAPGFLALVLLLDLLLWRWLRTRGEKRFLEL